MEPTTYTGASLCPQKTLIFMYYLKLFSSVFDEEVRVINYIDSMFNMNEPNIPKTLGQKYIGDQSNCIRSHLNMTVKYELNTMSHVMCLNFGQACIETEKNKDE